MTICFAKDNGEGGRKVQGTRRKAQGRFKEQGTRDKEQGTRKIEGVRKKEDLKQTKIEVG